jgi:hypothetical protein
VLRRVVQVVRSPDVRRGLRRGQGRRGAEKHRHRERPCAGHPGRHIYGSARQEEACMHERAHKHQLLTIYTHIKHERVQGERRGKGRDEND